MKSLLINLFLFGLFTIYSWKATAQTNYYDIDSLKKLLIVQKEDTERANTLDLLSGDYFHNDDYENTLKSAQVLLLLSIKLHYVQGIVYGYADIAQAYALMLTITCHRGMN